MHFDLWQNIGRNNYNANNVAERLRKNSIRFSLGVHIVYFHFPFIVMGLDLGWNKGRRDYNTFAFYPS